ncbi:MAG: hypothetical protein JNL29_15705 [Nitrospira sp.]|nr:hypothetical protein [Nitrospira sp.]
MSEVALLTIYILHKYPSINAERERGGKLLCQEFGLCDSGKEIPKPCIDGIPSGPDNAKHCGEATAFVGKIEAMET